MENIHEIQNGNNPLQRRQRQRRPRPILRVCIDATAEGTTAYYAAILRVSKGCSYILQGHLENLSAERAWAYALSICYEWRDVYLTYARLVIDEQLQEFDRRCAA